MRLEDNQENHGTNQLSALSQKFTEYGAFYRSRRQHKVFTEIGYLNRKNDSLQDEFSNEETITTHWYQI